MGRLSAVEGTHVMDDIRDLAAAFDKRAMAGTESVEENLAELREIWPAEPTLEALRVVAGGCGRTAFTVAAEHSDPDRASAAVLLGLAQRAFDLAVRQVTERSVTGAPDPVRLPGTQFAVARMRATLATMTAVLDRYTADSVLPRFYLAGEAEQVVSTAYGLVTGGEAATRIGQIWRDLKAAPPFSADLARELIGKTALGIDPTETPRWL